MDIIKLHRRFKDSDSPSPKAQIRWLQKQGFAQQQIDQAMLLLYTDIEQNKPPLVFIKKRGGSVIDTKYAPHGTRPPHFEYDSRPIKNGWEFDQALLEFAKIVRTRELEQNLKSIEEFEKIMKKKWKNAVPIYKRIFGIKPKD